MVQNLTHAAGSNSAQYAMEQSNFGEHVITNQVQETVYGFMIFISLMIFAFLAIHLFIRYHYKAKTEYALNEMREKFEKAAKRPSPYALAGEPDETGKPVEITLEPADLGPMLHNAALAAEAPVPEKPNKHVVYMDAN